MVLSGFVAGFINQYFSQYVRNVDPKNVATSLMGGKLSLHNVELKTEALDFLQLPIEVHAGKIGRMMLSLSYTRLSTEPVTVVLKDIYLIARNRTSVAYDLKEACNAVISAKLAKLENWQKKQLSPSPTEKNNRVGKEKMKFQEKLALTILKNLQVTIENIHIRFEDHSNGGKFVPCAGVCMKQLTICTTDADFKKKFDSNHQSKIHYKLLEFKDLGVYFNPKSNRIERSELLGDYFEHISEYKHLVSPFGGYLRARLSSDVKNTSEPKLAISCGFPSLRVSLAKEQYRSCLDMLLSLSRTRSRIDEILKKAKNSVDATEEANSKNQSKSCQERYILIYKKNLNTQGWLSPKTEAEEKELLEMEQGLKYEALISLRLTAMAEVRRQLGPGKDLMLREDSEAEESKNKSMFGWVFGRSNKSKAPHVLESELQRERESLYASIEFNANDNSESEPNLPKNYTHLKVEFRLVEFSLELLSDTWSPLITCLSKGTEFGCEINEGQFRIQGHMQNLAVNDDSKDSVHKLILYQDNVDSTGKKPLVTFGLEMPSLDLAADTVVTGSLQRTFIVLNSSLMSTVSRFFSSKDKEEAQSLELISSWSERQTQHVLDAATNAVASAVESHSSLWVSFDLRAPTFVLPTTKDIDGKLVVIETGHLKISTELATSESKSALKLANEIRKGQRFISTDVLRLKEIHHGARRGGKGREIKPSELDVCYDTYRISGSNFQIYLMEGGLSWRTRLQRNQIQKGGNSTFVSPSDLMSPFDVNLLVHRSTLPNTMELPQIRVAGELSHVTVGLNPKKIQGILRTIRMFQDDFQTPTALENHAEQNTFEHEAHIGWDRTSELKGELLSKSSRATQTFAELKHAFGRLAEVDEHAKMLLEEAGNSKEGIPAKSVRQWWGNRIKKLEDRVILEATFHIKQISVHLAKDADESRHLNQLPVEFSTELSSFRFQYKSFSFEDCFRLTISSLSAIDNMDKRKGQPRTILSRFVEERGVSVTSNLLELQINALQPSAPNYTDAKIPSETRVNLGGLSLTIEPRRIEALLQCINESTNIGDISKRDDVDRFGGVHAKQPVAGGPIKDVYFFKRTGVRMNLRSEPSTSADLKTGILLEPGTTFRAVERIEKDRQVFLKIESGTKSGWAFLFDPINGRELILPFSKMQVTRDEIIQTKISCRLEELQINLLWDGKKIADTSITDVQSIQMQYVLSQDIEFSLKEICLRDFTPMGSNHPRIVQTLRQDVNAQLLFKCKYSTFDKHEKGFPGYRSALVGQFRGLRVTYSQRFIFELMSYFMAGSLGRVFFPQEKKELVREEETNRIVQNPKHSRSAKAPEKAEDSGTEFTFLEFRLENVEIAIPESSSSLKGVVAKIHSISIRSEAQNSSTASPTSITSPERKQFLFYVGSGRFQRLVIQLSKFSLAANASPWEEKKGAYFAALGPVHISYDSWSSADIAVKGIWIHVANVEGQLTKIQYQLVMSTLTQNLCEEANVVDAQKMDHQHKPQAAMEAAKSYSRQRRLMLCTVNITKTALTLLDPKNRRGANVLFLYDLKSGVRFLGSRDQYPSSMTLNLDCQRILMNTKTDKCINEQFRDVITIGKAQTKSIGFNMQALMCGGVDLEHLVPGNPCKATYDVKMTMQDFQFIVLESMLVDLIMFFEMPAEVIKDGWVMRGPYPIFQRYLTLKRFDYGRSIPPSYFLQISLDPGGVPIRNFDLREVRARRQSSAAMVIFADGQDDEESIKAILHLASTLERNAWVREIEAARMQATSSHRNVEIPSPPRNVAVDRPASTSESSMVVDLSIKESKLVLLQKPSDVRTDGIVFCWGLDVIYESRGGKEGMSQIGVKLAKTNIRHAVFTSRVPIFSSMPPLLSEFGIQATAITRYWDFGSAISSLNSYITNVSIMVDPLRVEIQPRMITLIADIVKNVQNALLGTKDDDEQSKDNASVSVVPSNKDTLAQEEKHPEAQTSDNTEGVNARWVKITQLSKRQKASDLLKKGLEIELRTKEVSVCFTVEQKDSFVPVARFSLKSVDFRTKSFSHRSNAKLSFHCGAEYFNTQCSHPSWDPIVENFMFTMHATATSEPQVQPKNLMLSGGEWVELREQLPIDTLRDISVVINDPVDAHVNVAMLRSIRTAFDRFMNGTEKGSADVVSKCDHYDICGGATKTKKLEKKIPKVRRMLVNDVDVCFENERYYPFKKWSQNLLPTDYFHWSSNDGKTELKKENFETHLRDNTVILSNWAHSEWEFAVDFPRRTNRYKWKPSKNGCFVRRRKWTRKLRHVVIQEAKLENKPREKRVFFVRNLLPDAVTTRLRFAEEEDQYVNTRPGMQSSISVDPSMRYNCSFQLKTVGPDFSSDIELEPVAKFMENDEVDFDGHVMIRSQDGNEFYLQIAMLRQDSEVMMTVSAPCWIFDSTGLGLVLSKDEKNGQTFRTSQLAHAPKEAVKLRNNGEIVQDCALLSLKPKDRKKKFYWRYFIRLNPEGSISDIPTLPPRPTSVLGGIEAKNLAMQVYSNQSGERVVNTFPAAQTKKTRRDNFVALTSLAVVVIVQSRLQQRIRLSKIRQVVLAAPQWPRLVLKDGSKHDLLEMHSPGVAQFFLASVTRILNESLGLTMEPVRNTQWAAIHLSRPYDTCEIKANNPPTGSNFCPRYDIGFTTENGQGLWNTTRFVTIVPAITIVNDSCHFVEVMQVGTNSKVDAMHLKPQSSLPWYWPSHRNDRQLRFRFVGRESDEPWSSFFNIDHPGNKTCRITDTRRQTTTYIKVEVRPRPPQKFVVISLLHTCTRGFEGIAAAEVLPYRIENRCFRDSFYVRQKSDAMSDEWIHLRPCSHVPFALADFLCKEELEVKLDQVHSDAEPHQKLMVLSLEVNQEIVQNKTSSHTIKMKSRFPGIEEYTIHMYVIYQGSVKVVCLSEERVEFPAISPYDPYPLDSKQRNALERHIRDLTTAQSHLRSQLNALRTHAVRVKGIPEMKRHKDVPPNRSILWITTYQTRGVQHDRMQQLKLKISLVSDLQHISTTSRILNTKNNEYKPQTVKLEVDGRLHDAKSSFVKFELFLLNPLTNKSRLLDQIRLSLLAYSSHTPSRKEIKFSKHDKHTLECGIWWIPETEASYLHKQSVAQKCLAQREHVAKLFTAKLRLSQQYHAQARGLIRRLLAEPRMSPGIRASDVKSNFESTFLNLSKVRLQISVTDVTGPAFTKYSDLGSRLVLVFVVQGTSQTVCEVLRKNGHATAGFSDDFTFELPRFFSFFKQLQELRIYAVAESCKKCKKGRTVMWDSKLLGSAILDTSKFKSVPEQSWVPIASSSGEVLLKVKIQHSIMPTLMNKRSSTTATISLGRIGIVVGNASEEVLYFSIRNIQMSFEETKGRRIVKLNFDKFQIDNQRNAKNILFPVVVHESPIPRGSKRQSMIQIAVHQSKQHEDTAKFTVRNAHGGDFELLEWKDEELVLINLKNPEDRNSGNLHTKTHDRPPVFPYISILIQPIHVNIEENIMNSLNPLLAEWTLTVARITLLFQLERETSPKTYIRCVDAHNVPPADEQDFMVDVMSLNSMRITVNFEPDNQKKARGLRNLMKIVSIDNLELRIKTKHLLQVHLSLGSILSCICDHYFQEIKWKIVHEVFNLDSLGKPLDLVEGLAGGVVSFFVDPIESVVEDPGVMALGRGVWKGTSEMVSKSFSVFGSAGKITGSLGKNLALLSMDAEYHNEHARSTREKKKHLISGLVSAGKSLGSGIIGGITGLATKPIEGTKKDGVKGFFKGAGKGLLGVIVKPVAGTVSAASSIAHSVEGTVNLALGKGLKDGAIERVRPPRKD